MTIRGPHHLVLRIPDLGEAEPFSRDLFGLDAPFREGSTRSASIRGSAT